MKMDRYDICITALPGDAEMAGALRDSIFHFRLPKGTVLSTEPGYNRIVMDLTGSDLDEAACDLLSRSRFLLVRLAAHVSNGCKTRGNKGTRDRLDYFRRIRGGDHVILVLLEGEPDEAFPDNFSEQKLVRHIMPDMSVVERMEKIEPVAADLRGDTASRRREALRYETVRIIAAVLGIHPDVLMQRHRARRRRAVMASLALAGAISLAAAGIFLRLGLIAKREGDIAREQTRLSVEIVERTLEDLPVLFEGDENAMEYVEQAMESARESLRELGLDEPASSENGEAAP